MEQAQKQEPGAAEENAGTKTKRSFWRRRPVAVVGTLVLFGLLFLGLRYLAEGLTHESTDDAFLDANVVSLAPKVPGQVKKVCVENNQAVKAGDLLVEIDPRDLAVQLEQKRAALNAARANLDLLKASFELRRTQISTAEATTKQSTAEVAAAEATAEKAKADLKRAEELIQNHTISPQEFDSAKAAATAAEANLKAMDGAVVLERDQERPHGDRRAIELGGGDAALRALRVLDNDLIPRAPVSEHYLETGP